MIKILRTSSGDQHFLKLVSLLDAELAVRDGNEHTFYSQFNKLDNIRHVVVAYEDDVPAGCGAIKEFSTDTMEVKRMFVLPGNRRKGIAAKILRELEIWAAELSYKKCILETGKKQPEAIELYRRNGYLAIPNYGQYAGVENSVCFLKHISG
ncbi:MAG: GNAT family N-acetyltransferase [Bacteroidetes bacterium]|nr:GNAT family N-acetyltransferase [Bacteroidota bacterium]